MSSCQRSPSYFEFGATVLTSHSQILTLDGAGVRIFTEELLGGSAYQEFTIKRVSARPYTDEELEAFIADGKSETIGGAHDDSLVVWPTLLFTITLNRASRFFVVQVILPMIMFAYASFGAFWINVGSGERLGYGITLILAMVAFDLWTSGFVPKCSETIFLTELDQLCGLAATLAMVETMLVLFLFYKQDGSLMPNFIRHFDWVRQLELKLKARSHHKSHVLARQHAIRHQRSSISLQHLESVAEEGVAKRNPATDRNLDASPIEIVSEPPPSSIPRLSPPPPQRQPPSFTAQHENVAIKSNTSAGNATTGSMVPESAVREGELAALAASQQQQRQQQQSAGASPLEHSPLPPKPSSSFALWTPTTVVGDGLIEPLVTTPVAGLITLGKLFYHSEVRTTHLERKASAHVS